MMIVVVISKRSERSYTLCYRSIGIRFLTRTSYRNDTFLNYLF